MIRNFLKYTLVLGLFLAFPYGAYAEMTKSEIETTYTSIKEHASKATSDEHKAGVCNMIKSIDVMLAQDTSLAQWKTELDDIMKSFDCVQLLDRMSKTK